MIDRRPETDEYDQKYKHYIELVPENDLIAVMLSQLEETISFLSSIPSVKYDYQYAANKWTVREVTIHICDVERTFGYRVLCAAKGYQVELKRIDYNQNMHNDNINRLPLVELSKEFEFVRKSNAMFLKHLPDVAWDCPVFISDAKFTILALGYLMVGHERHHLRILKERYIRNS